MDQLFRPTLSATGAPNYKLANFLVLTLSDRSQYEFQVQDSFNFCSKILTQDNDLGIAAYGRGFFIYQHPIRWNYWNLRKQTFPVSWKFFKKIILD